MQHFFEPQCTDAEYEQWFSRQVQIGIEAADAGEVIPSEEVEAEFASRRACSFFLPASSKKRACLCRHLFRKRERHGA
jgi:hypothetical protein